MCRRTSRDQIVDIPEGSQPPAKSRSEEAAVAATASPAPAAAESARVTVVGGAGPLVLSSLLWVPLTVAAAAVAVHGAGRGWAGVVSGPFPLGWSAVVACVARRRAEIIQDVDRNLHIGAPVAVHRI